MVTIKSHIKSYCYKTILILWITSFLLLRGYPAFSISNDTQNFYGHRVYEVVSETQIQAVGEYRSIGRIVKLLPNAASAFQKMQNEARRDGIEIIPISGYRSYSYQEKLFKRAVKKYGSEERAAHWVAPPGYSEHHTGLALDIGDRAYPQCDVEVCFEKTPAHKWLIKNANRFGYELSFPNKGSRISFEPWHWRFVKNSEGVIFPRPINK